MGTDNKTYFPDIILYKDDNAYIVDPTVVWDASSRHMALAGNKKVTKYECLREVVGQMTHCGNVEVYPVVVGARGAWPQANRGIERILQASNAWVSRITQKVLCKSVAMLRDFMDQ